MKSALLAAVVIGSLSIPTFGIGDFERGNRLYRQGHFAEAVVAYQQAIAHGKDTPELEYNLGTTLLQLGKYAEAEQHFKAALTNVDPALRQKTYYNLGNRFLDEARNVQEVDTARTNMLLDSAIVAY